MAKSGSELDGPNMVLLQACDINKSPPGFLFFRLADGYIIAIHHHQLSYIIVTDTNICVASLGLKFYPSLSNTHQINIRVSANDKSFIAKFRSIFLST